MIYFSSDWHLDHARILTYCRRLEFMSQGERDRFFEVEEKYKEATARQEPDSYRIMKSLTYSRESVDRMNDAIIENCNAKVGVGDIIVFVGDIIFGDYYRLKELRSRIKCRDFRMIWGNHDKRLKKLWEKDKSVFYDIFSQCRDVTMINYNNQKIWVSHFAHAVWDQLHYGVWHCYGHSHSNFASWREEHMPKAKMVDVGIDYRAKLGKGYTLWSFDDLKQWMNV
jgi:calcineurin-like phosphoesterase family protein